MIEFRYNLAAIKQPDKGDDKMDTINISASTRKLQICASKDGSLDVIFCRKGYAFATNGHMAVIRRTDADEPQEGAVNLPIPGTKVKDMGFRIVEGTNILVSMDGAVTGSMPDVQGPDLEQLLKSRTSRGQPIRITISAKYLLDIAKALGADKDMHVTLELDANNLNQMILVATRDSSTLGILMPVRDETVPSDILAPILAAL